MSSSRSRVNREPEVTAVDEEASDEESNGDGGDSADGAGGADEDEDEDEEGDEGDEEKKDIQRGHHQAKSVTEGKILFY